jgi:Mg2+ and Co2+ transporter CorA
MTFKAEKKQAEEKLLSFGGFIKEDRNSLQEIKDISKQLKKIISSAEKEIKNTESALKKTRKELKKTKGSKKEVENNAVLEKIREQEKELLSNYNEKTSGTRLELTNKCQEAQTSIQKLKIKEVI